jgi:hypothetical protein
MKRGAACGRRAALGSPSSTIKEALPAFLFRYDSVFSIAKAGQYLGLLHAN